ncbi:MAG: DEAD/DEAH box helicase family protein [Candidatus Obscuribacterales bacterium]|nr:DEAD/DEAH box helicase family protein [Candidatus Obscuribacterales bacterium]
MSENPALVSEEKDETSPLAGLSFRFPLRRYQQEILELIKLKMARGERELHIVAPPGAGKTIIGLQLAAELQQNTLIISPTTTIQAQWGEKLNLFLPVGEEDFGVRHLLGTHEDKPLKPITLLTYQVLSTPGREQEYLEKLAHKGWVEELIEKGLSHGDAELRILELLQNNSKAYDKEMSRHLTRLRRKLTDVLDISEVIHPNALALIQSLRRQKFKTVIFDECHHLTDYWAAIMTHLIKRLDNPLVIGLTGTPPEGKSQSQENRYLSIVGEIDYQVPTPALVREGGLAPFQDLVYFVSPTFAEEKFLEDQHEEFHTLLEELSLPEGALLTKWVEQRINDEAAGSWKEFANKQRDLASAFIRYAWKHRLALPLDQELSTHLMQSPLLDDWMNILEDFALNCLKVSASTEDHHLYEKIRGAIAKLGYGLTEKGIRKQASPVDRVLAFSKSKSRAVAEILSVEHRNLAERLRCAVVTDFERMSATAAKQTKGVLTEESGGAIAVLRELLKAEVSAEINPCLVTGSLILIDKRIQEQFCAAMQEQLCAEGFRIELSLEEHYGEAFVGLKGSSSEWEARLYVRLATKILERGITKTLIGTRGIFGEGWDCQSLNTLIDLTTTTTPVSVKQLRGRSIRINTTDPLGGRKVANNWDVVCIAPYLEKGLNDYQRFARKHEGYFGICDDGQVECGVGHVHPSFSELSPAEIFANLEDFNQEMRLRALVRDGIYDLWKVGEPYQNKTLGCVEITKMRKLALTPPNIRQDLDYPVHSKMLRDNLTGVILECGGLGALISLVTAFFVSNLALPGAVAILPFLGGLALAHRRYSELYSKLKKEICRPNTQESSLFDMARAILSGLQHAKLLPSHLTKDSIKLSIRSDGSYRLFLDNVDSQQSQYFVKCVKELLAPVRNQPYLIPKYEYVFPEPRNKGAEKNSKRKLLKVAQTNIDGLAPESESVVSADATSISAEASSSEFNADPKATDRIPDPTVPMINADPGLASANPQAPTITANDTSGVASASESAPDEETMGFPLSRKAKLLPKTFKSSTNVSAIDLFAKSFGKDRFVTAEAEESEDRFFKAYLKGRAEPRIAAYYPVPSLLARSEKGRAAFESAWNKYVSPGFIVATEDNPELLNRYFGMGASLAQRLLWE